MKQRWLLFWVIVICVSVFTSCKKEEGRLITTIIPYEVSADISTPVHNIPYPRLFTGSGPKGLISDPWGDEIRVEFPYGNDMASCVMRYNMYNYPHWVMVELYLDYFQFEYDKVYYLDEPMEMPDGETFDIKRVMKAAFGQLYYLNTTNGWVKFTNRRVEQPYYYRFVCIDIEFGFEVYDEETGELLVKCENGKVTCACLGEEEKYLRL